MPKNKLSSLLCQSFNQKKRIQRQNNKINDHQRLTMLLSTHDVKRVRQLLAVALRRGSSPRYLMGRLERAISGLYNARGLGGKFSQRELHIALLAKAHGGPRLLYALNKSHGLPSPSTVNESFDVPCLLPCIKMPCAQDVHVNADSLLSPHIKPAAPSYPSSNKQAGVEWMVDDVSTDEKGRYIPKYNAIGGICRQHVAKTKVTDIQEVTDVKSVAESVNTGKCHFGKDATVAAIAPYGRTDYYGATPLIASPTCKNEDGISLSIWLRACMRGYNTHKYGRARQGPIWALASDGEASFRKAKFELCMTHQIPRDSELGLHLYQMSGMNVQCGEDGIISTCDPKHVFKRMLIVHCIRRRNTHCPMLQGFATLLRNPKGIMVLDTNIQSHDVFEHLQALPSMTADTARHLLDPADKQNVPKAVHLMQSLLKLNSKDARVPSSPSQLHRRQTLIFIARTFGHFLLPFITVTLSLSKQLRSLSTYAHLAAAMWIRHGTSFMTGALYADSQAIVRNIFITTLRLREVNESLPFHIILEGTDRLETLFADCRTQDHARNFDILQLCEKLSVSVLINGIFEQNPDLDRGHRRLDLRDAMGIDRVNPKSWRGDVVVGNVDVVAEWAAGQADANKLLADFFGKDACIDFDSLFARESHDLLRPQGQYVGIRHTPDDDRTETEATDSPAAEEDDDYDDVPIGVDIDDMLPDHITPGQPLPDKSPLLNEPSRFMQIGDKRYLKSSVVTAFLTSNRGKKVPMRTLRNQGVTDEDLQGGNLDLWNATDPSADNTSVGSGGVAATLVAVGEGICLAVVEIIGFQIGSADPKRAMSVSMEELQREDPPTSVSVQVLRLARRTSGTNNDETWEWTRRYVRSNAKSHSASQQQHTFTIPGHHLHLLTSQVAEVASTGAVHTEELQASIQSTADDVIQGNVCKEDDAESESVLDTLTKLQAQTTWTFTSTEMQVVLKEAWDALDPEAEEILGTIALLPHLETPDLPYKNLNGQSIVPQI